MRSPSSSPGTKPPSLRIGHRRNSRGGPRSAAGSVELGAQASWSAAGRADAVAIRCSQRQPSAPRAIGSQVGREIIRGVPGGSRRR